MLGFICSVLSYLASFVVFAYFAGFSDGVGVSKSVDSGAASGLGVSLAVDVALLLLFGLQHSLMARTGFKHALTRVVPQHLERATYVLGTTAALALLIWQWRPLPGELWRSESFAVAASLWTVNFLGWLGVPLVSLMIDHFELFGIKPAFYAFRRKSLVRPGFVVPLLYKYVRHPMMCAFLVAFWVTPHMTVGHLLLSAGMTCYIVIGVHFEERALVRELDKRTCSIKRPRPSFCRSLRARTRATAQPAPSARADRRELGRCPPLDADESGRTLSFVDVTCAACSQKNRVPASRLQDKARCAACKAPLLPLSHPLTIASEAEFEELIREAKAAVVVDFWAAWCGPCRAVAPEVEKLAASRAGQVIVVKVDTEALPRLSARFEIRSIPTLLVFRGGREQRRISGAMPAAAMATQLGV